ncbi:MAG: site-2 protease family protein [Methanobrevibacter sp.]|nr:site-2 protease family protein [Candidatus Methanoflexus mossambicus]
MKKFSSHELVDLLIAFVIISLAFTLLYTGMNTNLVSQMLPMIMIGVGSGFIFHELAHKLVAMHYGYYAEFKLWMPGLFLALISSVIGFLFAAPGAVHIYGQYMNDKDNGIISEAGPLINIILGAIFFVLGAFFIHSAMIGSLDGGIANFLIQTCLIGFSINGWLALFNLIPFSVFDGAKILRWNGIIWLITAIFAGLMVFISFTGVEQYILPVANLF